MKKILMGLAAAGTAIAMVPLFAAFEAHVINVTARIENALSVPVTPITFGTVFPQEQLDGELPIQLSKSFFDEDRVDDVEYIIRQKPKCGVVHEDGTVDPSWTGHVVTYPVYDPLGIIIGYRYYVDCEKERPITVPSNEQFPEFYLLPSLCPYLSKHSEVVGEDEKGNPIYEDGSLPAFHQPFTIDQQTGQIIWKDVSGYLSKLAQDTLDNWIIDLKVPCFGGYCAQDWADYVYGINPDADPDDYVQPIENEHKVFGCNLWVEVSGVSEARD